MGVAQSLENFLCMHEISIRSVACAIGVREERLQASISCAPSQRLSGDDFLKICRFLNEDPYCFWTAPALLRTYYRKKE